MIILFSAIIKKVIFDFDNNADTKDWIVVNDVVMGGKSLGYFKVNNLGHGLFEGSISLENNGGFSSVHYRFDKMEVKEFTKVIIRLKGDGKNYQFRVKSNSNDYYSYIKPFTTTGVWENIEIPLKDMYPSFRGRRLEHPNFSKDYIEEIAFLIANGKNEHFKLLLDKIALE
ncbi:CIA30 family protein [Tamlana flava]|uniref:CIA30 family protein n=1 Tax=Tamlana flava TaxID=3158572 RepID=UPI00351B2C44